jgi:hypothetical protein
LLKNQKKNLNLDLDKVELHHEVMDEVKLYHEVMNRMEDSLMFNTR